MILLFLETVYDTVSPKKKKNVHDTPYLVKSIKKIFFSFHVKRD